MDHKSHTLKASKHIKIADHMLYVTYPLIQDPKLLMAILDNIYLALQHSLDSILSFERLYKRIPPYPQNINSKLDIFNKHVIPRYRLPKRNGDIVHDIKDIIVEHKKSPIEFQRKDKFVICNNDYRMKMISVPEIKAYISKAKLFIQETAIIVENERSFGQRT